MSIDNTKQQAHSTSSELINVPTHHQPPSKLDVRTKSRLFNLRADLADIKQSLDIRTYFILHNQHAHYFCPTCTPSDLPGSCGPICPLLRPHNKASASPYPMGPEWLQRVRFDARLYKALTQEINRYGDVVNSAKLRLWEKAAARLQMSARNLAEWHEGLGWTRVEKMKSKEAGIRVGWQFEREWGRKRSVGEDGSGVAPECRSADGVR